MRDEPDGALTRELTDQGVDPTEPDLGCGDRFVGARVEVWLQPRESIVGAFVVHPLAGAERVEEGAEHIDVLAKARHRCGPRHAIAILDVLSDLGADAQLEPPTRHDGEIPRGIGGEQWAAHEGERDARAHNELVGVLERERRDHERVVHGLGDV
ncbi:unannotated protein [freshwater metagenome]